MKKAIFAALLGLVFALPAQASVIGIGDGDLIKIENDHNPATVSDTVVYYLDRDWKRHPFPNLQVFYSWYHDFLPVKEISAADMASFKMGTPVTYRPGTRLVKIASVPKVYAVEPGGVLRWIESEAVAKTLYGNDWNKRVDDVAESYFASYHEGVPMTVPVWPTGTVVRRLTDGATFVIDGLQKHPLALDDASALRLYSKNFVSTSDALTDYDEVGPVKAGDPLYLDTSEMAKVETEPQPAIDFPDRSVNMAPGMSRVLTSFRMVTGAPAILRRLVVSVSGLPAGGTSMLKNFHVTDSDGNDLFGIQQLPDPVQATEMLTFTGAYTTRRDSINVIQVRADVPMSIPSGTNYGASIARSGIQLFDAGNGTTPLRFWFPTTVPSAAK